MLHSLLITRQTGKWIKHTAQTDTQTFVKKKSTDDNKSFTDTGHLQSTFQLLKGISFKIIIFQDRERT